MKTITVEMSIDVSSAVPELKPARIAASLTFSPGELVAEGAVACFARPGAGFTRKYYTSDLPGPTRGSQAHWHARKGWIFVAMDHLGVGDSSQHEASLLTFDNVTSANVAAERVIIDKLAQGEIHSSLPPIENPTRLALGQSMGGCLTIVQAAHFHCYDGIAVLGYGAYHTHPPVPPGEVQQVAAWRVPGNAGFPEPSLLNEGEFTAAFKAAQGEEPDARAVLSRRSAGAAFWHFYREDVQPFLRQTETDQAPPEWISPVRPALLAHILTPGIIAPQAAAVDVPVLLAMGDRDVVVDPRGEPRSYLSAPSIDLFVCPNMGHMHNFAGTRELFWQRISHWGSFVAEARLHNLRA